MSTPKITNVNPNAVELSLEVIVVEENNSVYVKIDGFESLEEADAYADHLADTLPLLLFETEIKH